jgi:hypothetical protein
MPLASLTAAAGASSDVQGDRQLKVLVGELSLSNSSGAPVVKTNIDLAKDAGAIFQSVVSASITNADATVTVASTTGLLAGMQVSGVGIPPSTTILSITNATSFELSANATATNAAASLTIQDAQSVQSEKIKGFNLLGWDVIDPAASTQTLTVAVGDSNAVAVGNRFTNKTILDGETPNLMDVTNGMIYDISITLPNNTIGATGSPLDWTTGALVRYAYSLEGSAQ